MFINVNSIMIVYPLSSGSPKNLGLYQKSGSSFVETTDNTFVSGKVYYVSMGQYLVEAKYGYNKLWANDSGRNLKGEMTGSLVGVFPKITVQFRKLTKSELEFLTPILDSASQKVTYYDPRKKQNYEMGTYTGDWELTDKSIISNTRKNEGFSISFIARKKRT